MLKGPAIGIDIGATYSRVGVFHYGSIEIIANEQGNRATPSYVAFTETDLLVGEAAESQASANPKNTISKVNLLMGKKFDDKLVQKYIKRSSFNVVNKNGKPTIRVEFKNETKIFTPEDIVSMILVKMKEIAESYLKIKVTNAVITVPANFNYAQCQATKYAGDISGLNVLQIIKEPMAAAIAYGLSENNHSKNILIFDLGGNTLNVTIITVENGIFEVQSTCGDTDLGGEIFVNTLANHFVKKFNQKYIKNMRDSSSSMKRLRAACELAKIELSFSSLTTIEIGSLFEGIDIKSTISRAKFDELCNECFESTINPVEKVMWDVRMDNADIHDIILVGGSSRIPKIQHLLQNYFNGKELNKSINPDEAIVYGAAMQAAILNGDDTEMLQELLIFDAIPVFLGIQIAGGKIINMIDRYSTKHTRETKVFTTLNDNQTSALVQVFEVNQEMTKHILLGKFLLSEISKSPRYVPKIIIAFEILSNEMLYVSATDKSSGNKNNISINLGASTKQLTPNQNKQIQIDSKIIGDLQLTCLTPIPTSLGIQGVDGRMITFIQKDTLIPIKKTKFLNSNSDVIIINVCEGEHTLARNNNQLEQFHISQSKSSKISPQFDITFEINGLGILKVSAINRITKNKSKIVLETYKTHLNRKMNFQSDRKSVYTNSKILIDLVEVNVTSSSFGIQNNEGRFITFIDRHTAIPTNVTKIIDDHSNGLIQVHEQTKACNCNLMGLFQLIGLDKDAKLKVTFDIDKCGTLKVSAVDEKSRKEGKIKIKYIQFE